MIRAFLALAPSGTNALEDRLDLAASSVELLQMAPRSSVRQPSRSVVEGKADLLTRSPAEVS